MLARALVKDPDGRFQTSAALANALRDLSVGRAVVLPSRVGGRRPVRAVAVAALLVIVVAAASAWLLR